MITFTQLGKMGRLGNQLFQYAALRSLSLEKNYECKIPNPEFVEWHGQKCLLNNFNIKAGYLSDEDYKKIKFNYVENNVSIFDTNFFYMSDGVNLNGFFQSYKYFEKHVEKIIQELSPKKELLLSVQEKFNN